MSFIIILGLTQTNVKRNNYQCKREKKMIFFSFGCKINTLI